MTASVSIFISGYNYDIGTADTYLRGGPIGRVPGGNLSELGSVNLYDVSFSQAENGMIDYYCFYLYVYPDDSASTEVYNIFAPFLYPRSKLEFGLGTSGVNGVEQVIPDRFTAPSGVIFSDSIAIALAPNEHHAFWVKRIIRPKYVAYSYFDHAINIGIG